MSYDVLTLSRANMRGRDSNSLLRLYDHAKELFTQSMSKGERVKADKAIQRIAEELRHRNERL